MSRRGLVALLTVLALACRGGQPEVAPTPTGVPTPTAPPPSLASPTSPPSLTPPAETLVVPTPPDRDLFDLALRFGRIQPGQPRLVSLSPVTHAEGETQEFVLLDIDPPGTRTVRAVLRAISPHAYFFFEEGLAVDARGLARAVDRFEGEAYPTVTAAFGQEWSPGIDGDPRITILHAALRDAGGYFTAGDEFPRAAVPSSNQREMVYIHASLPLGSDVYTATLAHELQHLAHWNADAGEDGWVDEGLSQVASEAIILDSGFVEAFLRDPDLQLNDWAGPEEDSTPHYGASQLFFRYLLDRFGGRQRAGDLVRQAADGMAGIDAYLEEFGVTSLDVFADWLVANHLDAPSGPYGHESLRLAPIPTTLIESLGQGEGTVAQFGADYLEIEPPPGGAVFLFDGQDTVPAVRVEPRSGRAFWWSNRGDSIDSGLTCELDLTGLRAATLAFATWYEMEEGWDYGYIAISSDGGGSWRALPGQHTTDYDPVGQAYGPGYTGSSRQWLVERVDLSPFAGQKVWIRFEYVTDDSTNLGGFAIDDITVAEIGFREGAETAAGGCQPEGFLRVDRPLPQRWILQVIDRRSGQVRRLSLDEGHRAQVRVDSPVIIVVAAATDVTPEAASYRWSLTAP